MKKCFDNPGKQTNKTPPTKQQSEVTSKEKKIRICSVPEERRVAYLRYSEVKNVNQGFLYPAKLTSKDKAADRLTKLQGLGGF